jgi:hypothetical protein
MTFESALQNDPASDGSPDGAPAGAFGPSPWRPPAASTAGTLARPLPAVDVARTNDEVMAFLGAHPELESVAVLQEGAPVGLINRKNFLEAYVRPFAREVFGRRSCAEWMDRAPLRVDAATPVAELVRGAIAAGEKVLKDGFIATYQGRYDGIGSGFSLMEAMSALEVERSRKLLESIDYASMIQRSHLRASDAHLTAALADHGLVWEPRDVVGGDCYFFRHFPEGLFGAVLDCTGHGVPGAFMTLIALSFLEHAVTSDQREPGATLGGLNRYIKRVLGQGAAERPGTARSDDGLDGVCFWLPRDGECVDVASAHLGVFIAHPGEGPAAYHAGHRASVGYHDTPDEHEWPARRHLLRPGSLVAVATDGVQDQIGGSRRIALGRRRVGDLLGSARARGARAAAACLHDAVVEWQGDEPRRDDLLILAFSPRAA